MKDTRILRPEDDMLFEIPDEVVHLLQQRLADKGIDLSNPDGSITSPNQMRSIK